MAEFLLLCKCGLPECGINNINKEKDKWTYYIKCTNCNAYVEADTLSKVIEKWNTWDFYHENKIHDGEQI